MRSTGSLHNGPPGSWFKARTRHLYAFCLLALALAGVAAISAARAAESGSFAQQGAELTAGLSAPEVRFGRSVAVSADGNTAVVGASKTSGGAGAAWVFTRVDGVWSPSGVQLVPTDESGAAQFGRRVAVSGDGSTILVGGARDEGRQGAAWVFVRSGDAWVQQGPKLSVEEPHAQFGHSVALSDDGDTALIGASSALGGRGAAWVFTRSGESWSVAQQLTGEEEAGSGRFGYSVALSGDGDTALVGGINDENGEGAAWAFSRAGETWSQQGAKIVGAGELGDAHFGYGVALSSDGDTALIGGPDDGTEEQGAGWVFTRTGEAWAQQGGKLTVEELGGKLGYGVALSGDGDTALIGAPSGNATAGATWVYTRSGEAWTRQSASLSGKEQTRRDAFGYSVALSSDATTAVVGANRDSKGAGAAWVFTAAAKTESGEEEEKGKEKEKGKKGAKTTTSGGGGANGQQGSQTPQSGVLSTQTTVLPPPVLTKTSNLTPVSGHVLVKLPGSPKFTPLTTAAQVPFGTIIDARHGKVIVTTARRNGGTQQMVFFDGMFKITQSSNGVVLAALTGGNYRVCPTARERRHLLHAHTSRTSKKHVVRKLWAEGHGSYTTKGTYASGAVLGTRWLTEDLCEGTLIVVSTDRVAVTNLITHKRRIVKAGHRELVKAP
jgi:hypothetical protein